MLFLKNLHLAYEKKNLLNGVNIELKRNTVTSLLGPNGAGKTSLFNIISGFIKPDQGRISFNNINLLKLSPSEIAKCGITRTFQDLRIIKELTVKENIVLSFKNNPEENIFRAIIPKFINRNFDKKFEIKAKKILEQVNLSDVENKLAGKISYGQQKLLTLGCAIANEPELILLDEPVAGINIIFQEQIKKIVDSLKQAGMSILLIDHNAEFIDSVSDEILFLNEGNITKFQNYLEFKEIVLADFEYY
ncbi:MAG: ATP-binding cassette domain-containing protein [Ignavibacteriae bacterium]|nr:ATP-binding cassette domain-containing protein [Ignavibacteriota bacterium]